MIGDGSRGKVLRHDDVCGLPVSHRRGDDPLHLIDTIVRCQDRVHARRLGGDVDEVLKHAIAKRMVYGLSQMLISHAGHAHQVKDGRPLGLGSHHPTQRAQFAHSVGCAQHRRTPNAGIPVGGIRCVQFIRTTKPLDRIVRGNRVVERKRIVTGDTKTIGDAKFGEPINGIFGYCRLRYKYLPLCQNTRRFKRSILIALSLKELLRG